jgi:adenylyl-sulfate kinase
MVIWIIGLSGSGKSTLANEVVARANKYNNNTVLLDGDFIREMFDNDLGYSMADREKNAMRICQLGKFLSDQGMNVVTAILSLFPESRDWNRKNLENYYEVFIDCPLENLIKRDTKGLYKKFERGEITDVAGMDIYFDKPKTSDLVINNIDSKDALLNFAQPILEKMLIKNDKV